MGSIWCNFENDLLSWWAEYLASRTAFPLPPAICKAASASRLLALDSDSLRLIALRLLDNGACAQAVVVSPAAVRAVRRALHSLMALTCTCVALREALNAYGPLGAVRLEAMARLGLAQRWCTSDRCEAAQLRFCNRTSLALPWFFDEATEAGTAATLERMIARRAVHCARSRCCGGGHRRLAIECAAATDSLETVGVAPFTTNGTFVAHERDVLILAGGGAHSSAVAVLEQLPGGRRLSVLGDDDDASMKWHAPLDGTNPTPHDVSSVAVDAAGRAVAIVASDRDPEHYNVRYAVWLWVWRADGPPVRHVFMPPSSLLAAGVAGAYMHAQEVWFGHANNELTQLFVATSPVHMKLHGECLVNDDSLTERVQASLAATGAEDPCSHVEAPAMLALCLGTAKDTLKHRAVVVVQDAAGAAPIDVAHDRHSRVVALLMRVIYAGAGNVGVLCKRLMAERTSASEALDPEGDVVGARFVKLFGVSNETDGLRELATHTPYRARHWHKFVHGGPTSVALSSDGCVLATGFVQSSTGGVHVELDAIDAKSGRITQWRVVTIAVLQSLRHTPEKAIPLVVFSPTGRYVLVRDAAPQLGDVGNVFEVVDLGTYGENTTIARRAPRGSPGSCVRWVSWARNAVWLVPSIGLLQCGRKIDRKALFEAAKRHGAELALSNANCH